MAAKIKIMKMLQEIRGHADVTERRPAPRQPGLFLIQLRSHVVESRQQPRVRQIITVEVQDRFEIPRPVKIKHVAPTPGCGDYRPQQELSFRPSQV
jgi:hypothetical protein